MVLRYLKGTREYGIVFRNDGSTQMIVDVDADWAGCRDSRKSISGWICRLGGVVTVQKDACNNTDVGAYCNVIDYDALDDPPHTAQRPSQL